MTSRILPLLLVVLLTAVLLLPAALGLASRSPGLVWPGHGSVNSADTNVYLSMIAEVRDDGLLPHNLYDPRPHPGFQTRPLYVSLGLLARVLPGESPVLPLQIGRAVAILVFLCLVFVLAGRFYEGLGWRSAAWWLAVMGGGIGWLGIAALRSDLGSPEGSTPVLLLSPPHFVTALALVVAIALLLDRCWSAAPGVSVAAPATVSCVLALWLGLELPFVLAPLGCAVAGALALEAAHARSLPIRSLRRSLPLAAGAVVGVGWQLLLQRLVPGYAEWNRQHVTGVDTLGQIAAGLGLLLPLALLAVPRIYRDRNRLGALFLFFGTAGVMLSRLPVGYQARFLIGVPFAVAVVAGLGLRWLAGAVKPATLRAGVSVGLVALASISGLTVVGREAALLAHPAPPVFLPSAYIRAMQRLGAESRPGDVVLASVFSGNHVPAWAVRRSWIGHRVQTPGFEDREALWRELLRHPADSPHGRRLLESTGADWLFWSDLERSEASREGAVFDPSVCREAFRDGRVRVYALPCEPLRP